MHKFIKVLSLVVAVATVTVLAACNSKNAIVATVNGEKITKQEFMYYLTSVKSQIENEQDNDIPEDFWDTAEIDGQKVIENAKEKALEEIVKSFIAKQKAIENNVKIKSEQRQQINAALGQLVATHGKDGVDEYLSQFGLTSKIYEKQLENSYYRANLVELLTQDVDEQQAKEYFKNNIARVKHILILSTDMNTGENLSGDEAIAARTKADELLERAKGGEDFDKLVAEHSEDPGSTSQPDGYYLGKGFILGSEGGMVPEFETASLELEVGEVSDIVETRYGYHIIKRYENDESVFEENKEQVLAYTKNSVFDEMLDQWKSEAKIEKVDKVYNAIK